MKKHIAALLSVILVAVSCSMPTGSVLAVNPQPINFTDDFSGYTVGDSFASATQAKADGWGVWYAANRKSDAIVNDNDVHGNYGRSFQNLVHGFDFVQGQTYTLTMDVKSYKDDHPLQLLICKTDNRNSFVEFSGVNPAGTAFTGADKLTATVSTAWQTISTSFTVESTLDNAEGYALFIRDNNYSSTKTAAEQYFCLDNVNLHSSYAMTAAASGDGTAVVSKKTVLSGSNEQVTFTARANIGSSFAGWYDGDDQLVSALQVYTVAPTAAMALTAKFTSYSLIQNGGFDTITRVDNTNRNNSAALGRDWFTVNASRQIVEDGDNQCINTNDYYHQIITLQSNQKYRLSLRAKNTGTANFTLNTSIVNNAARGTNLFSSAKSFTVAPSDWTEYSSTFTTGTIAEGTYYAVRLSGSSTIGYIDDVDLRPVYAVTATGEGCAATVSADEAAAGTAVTFTASGTGDFVGWYDSSSTLVSESAVYTVEHITADTALHAVAEGGELLHDGGFDATTAIPAGTAIGTDFEATHVWYRVNGLTAPITEADGNACWSAQGYLHQSVALKNGGNYLLTFKAKKAEAATSDSATINALFCKTTNRGDSSASGIKTVSFTSTDEWVSYSILFENVAIVDATTYALRMYEGSTTQSQAVHLLVDDISLTRVTAGTTTFEAEFKGVAIRTSAEAPKYKQAFRFKRGLSEDLLNNTKFGDFKLVEYGTLAQREALLAGGEMTLDTTDVKVGISFQRNYAGTVSVNKIYAQKDNEIIYTGALIGISPANFGSSTNIVNYATRGYAIYENYRGDKLYFYDAMQSADIYGVAKTAYETHTNGAWTEKQATREYLYTNILSINGYAGYAPTEPAPAE